MKFQFNYAFDSRMLDALGYEPVGQTILVIRLVMTAIRLAEKNRVIFVTDDIDAKQLFEQIVIGNGEFGNDDECIYIETEDINKKTNVKAWEEWSKNINMKFDVAIMNPPYDRNLHLKILEEVIPHAEKIVNISPVRWLQDPFAPYSTRSDYRKFEESVSKKIESLDVIPAKKASELFDASFTMNLGIYVCSEQGGYNYHHDDSLITKIVQKTMESNWLPFNQKKFYQDGCVQTKPYVLNVAAIRTNEAGQDTPRIVCKEYANQCSTQLMASTSVFNGGSGLNAVHFEFDTEDERKNFWACYNHPFMLWTYTYWKMDANIRSTNVPYFGDYTHPWDYADFFAWFGLTEAEQERVMQEITEMQNE